MYIEFKASLSIPLLSMIASLLISLKVDFYHVEPVFTPR